MDHQKAKERENQCIQEQPPKCTAACPVHVDVRGMIGCITQGDYSAGFALFHRVVPFPGIISRICDHPCQSACKRVDADETIMINALERACTDLSGRPPRKIGMLPGKNRKIAIVGSGLSGLTAAADLAIKGYTVEVFEAGGRLGGRIRTAHGGILPEDVIAKDFSLLDELSVATHLNSLVGSAREGSVPWETLLTEFDACYLGLGPQDAKNCALPVDVGADGRIATN
ncbi:MAG TPA: NAD(P)-binding protein, partial [Dissulfurispiraceae bacterium]|nr:NAD(P)-binding protein [Dissulfurispiraceae bacterium]